MRNDREYQQLHAKTLEYRKFLQEIKEKVARETRQWGEIYEKIDPEEFFEELNNITMQLDRICDIACGSNYISRADYIDLMHAYEIIRNIAYCPQPDEEDESR